MMEFEVGDKVIYPNQGISVVESIAAPEGAGGTSFYRLRLLQKSTLVMVPLEKVAEVGLRPIMTDAEVEEVMDVLENDLVNEKVNWKTRYKDNSDRMKSGEPKRVATVLKGLFYLSQRKTLSFREKKMLDLAHHLTVTEIAEVAEEPLDAVETKVIEVLQRSRNGQLGLTPAQDEKASSAATSVVTQAPRRRPRKVRTRRTARTVSISINRY